MKLTPFNEIHKKLGAKMVEFAGFEMPIQYPNGIIHEHLLVRKSVGVFDVSHMGEFVIKGKDALALVQKLITNDATKLNIGEILYTAMHRNGMGIVDDLLVYRLEENKYLLVVNGANIDKDWAWCVESNTGYDCELINESDETMLLAVQGPNSLNTLQKLTDLNLSEIEYYNFKLGKLAGIDMIISRTGYTGELGFELYLKGSKADAENLWNKLMEAGKEFEIEAVGLASRDTLRLEKGFCLYGNDIDETTNAYEAGLGWTVKLAKGDFNGSDYLKQVKEEGPKRRLVGFVVEAEKFIPRHGYLISKDGNEIGNVTSGNLSPSLNKPIGLGYVKGEFKAPGTKIEIEARGKKFIAEVIKLPFL